MSGRSAAVETFLDSVFGASGGGSSKKAQARKTKGKKRKSSASKKSASSPSTSSVLPEDHASSASGQDLIYSTMDGDRLMDFEPEVAVPRVMKCAGVYAGLGDEDVAFTKIREQYNRQIASKPVPLDAGMAKVAGPKREDLGPLLSRKAVKLIGIDDRKRGGKPSMMAGVDPRPRFSF
ncbi:hypothetical protein Pmar_PMAR003277 [Perkinsus marinus ATCC 50983]|uniref:Uncharacterized protein n=1 Tax=Perkinsus marinus (strain ATCC 50983 / TXsc) TaxID=423536 RepID=C5KGW4_PERM5|nr:hypothetical protein Pmar_PMAR003277 [Perkinsus marinus ATCC 50983]EER15826.1 hypothetical protein Pmar_PMAR003277 [Perkinsus marinus ATCC 50983]|eukprot:XP_002784030.1 hypothetical protein Pmar_PMAR003277 [Perkinsus marinus ATCC 50983]